MADDRLSYLSGGGECIAKPYVQFTHLCSVNNYLPTVDFCCCSTGHVTYDDDADWSAGPAAAGALCCRYHQDWNHFRCLDVDDSVRLAESVHHIHCSLSLLRVIIVIVIIIITATTMFMVLSSCPKSLPEFTRFI